MEKDSRAAGETREGDLNKQSQSAGLRPEIRNPNVELRNKSNLNKQSQFDPALKGVIPCVARCYGDEQVSAGCENKANQSQFPGYYGLPGR